MTDPENPSIPPNTVAQLPCADVMPQPTTDNSFKLEKVIATIREDAHLPTRGSTR